MYHKKFKVIHFFAEPLSVEFSSPPAHSKNPPCPDQFYWQGLTWRVVACLAEWKDFNRRGRMAQNMQPQHIQIAQKRGSWGVGRYYFDVKTENGRCFRLYFDRAPQDATDRTGHWILLAELEQTED